MRTRLAVGALVLLALAVRVAYVLVVQGDSPPEGDALHYSAQAEELAAGHGFRAPFVGGPGAEHPPLTAVVTSAVARFTDGTMPQRLGMAVIGTGVVAAIAALAWRLAGPRAAVVAAAVGAVYPNLWMNDGVVMAEAPAALLVAGTLLVTYRLVDRPDLPTAAVAGALVGLATLTRAELALLLPFVVAPVLLRSWRPLVVATAIAGVVVAPWALWNLTRFEEPVLLSTNEGRTLRGANCEPTWYGTGAGLWTQEERCLPPVDGDPSVANVAYRRAALDFIADRPEWLPVVAAVRELRVWSLYAPGQMAEYNVGEDRPEEASWAGAIAYWTLLPLAVLGAVRLRRRGVRLAPLLGTFALVAVTAAAFYGLVRFRVPAEVSLVVLASAATVRP